MLNSFSSSMTPIRMTNTPHIARWGQRRNSKTRPRPAQTNSNGHKRTILSAATSPIWLRSKPMPSSTTRVPIRNPAWERLELVGVSIRGSGFGGGALGTARYQQNPQAHADQQQGPEYDELLQPWEIAMHGDHVPSAFEDQEQHPEIVPTNMHVAQPTQLKHDSAEDQHGCRGARNRE